MKSHPQGPTDDALCQILASSAWNNWFSLLQPHHISDLGEIVWSCQTWSTVIVGGESSVGKVLVIQVLGPEFNLQNPCIILGLVAHTLTPV